MSREYNGIPFGYDLKQKVATADSFTARKYWLTLGLTLAFGFVLNYFMIKTIPGEAIMAINTWVLLIGYFVCAFSGIAISAKSDVPAISFIGYLLVVVPVGVVITPFVQHFDPAIVEKAVLFTASLTFIMAGLGAMFPMFFRGIGKILFWALLASIVAELIMIFAFHYKPAFMDFIVAIIFMGFIGYDYSKALEDDATVDAAIDRAVALYLDIINLFIRILEIMGKK